MVKNNKIMFFCVLALFVQGACAMDSLTEKIGNFQVGQSDEKAALNTMAADDLLQRMQSKKHMQLYGEAFEKLAEEGLVFDESVTQNEARSKKVLTETLPFALYGLSPSLFAVLEHSNDFYRKSKLIVDFVDAGNALEKNWALVLSRKQNRETIEQGIANGKAWAFQAKALGLLGGEPLHTFGWQGLPEELMGGFARAHRAEALGAREYGYERNLAERDALIEACVELGHEWAQEEKFTELLSEFKDSEDATDGLPSPERTIERFRIFIEEHAARGSELALFLKIMCEEFGLIGYEQDESAIEKYARLGLKGALGVVVGGRLQNKEGAMNTILDLYKKLLEERTKMAVVLYAAQQ